MIHEKLATFQCPFFFFFKSINLPNCIYFIHVNLFNTILMASAEGPLRYILLLLICAEGKSLSSSLLSSTCRTDERTILLESFPHVNFTYMLHILTLTMLELHTSAFPLYSTCPLIHLYFSWDKDGMSNLERYERWFHCFMLNYSLPNQCSLHSKIFSSYYHNVI